MSRDKGDVVVCQENSAHLRISHIACLAELHLVLSF